MRTEYERFFNLVTQTSGCWFWKGSTYRGGYGHFRRKINGKWIMYKAHRYSYEYFVEDIPEGAIILHSCDITCCVNPSHLSAGSFKQNTKDMQSKGRWKMPRNPKHNNLDMGVARAVRLCKQNMPNHTQKYIANLFSISTAQVSRILSNQIWTEEN